MYKKEPLQTESQHTTEETSKNRIIVHRRKDVRKRRFGAPWRKPPQMAFRRPTEVTSAFALLENQQNQVFES